MLKIYHIFLLSVFLILTVQLSERPKAAFVEQIQKVYNKTWYSGYLNVQDSTMQNVVHHMHYFFFPSQSNSATDPVLFWFNGGPGCSSLLGALYEHGPFLINDAFGMLMNNKYAWNKKASVVYIESPSQVGFSYMTNKPDNYTWNDDAVSLLNRDSVLEFFEVWSEFKGLKTYIAGQSYAGIYVPTLFERLHDYNVGRPADQQVNIQGFAVGNGCTHEQQCGFYNDYEPFLMKLYLDYGFITQDWYNQVESKCANLPRVQQLPYDCQLLVNKTGDLMQGINIYDAYRPCYQTGDNLQSKKKSFTELRKIAMRIKTKVGENLMQTPPCVDAFGINSLMQSKAVRENLTIPTSVPEYSMCVSDDFNYDRSQQGSYHIYKKLIPLNKYKIVIYTGDSDPAVPSSGTFFWVNKVRMELQLPTVKYWRPWLTTQADNGPQNGGNVWELANNFKLVTFKGIGHMAPQWNIEGGQKMINHLMWDTEL